MVCGGAQASAFFQWAARDENHLEMVTTEVSWSDPPSEWGLLPFRLPNWSKH